MGYLLLKSPKELASENSRKHVFCIFEFLTVYTFFFRTGRLMSQNIVAYKTVSGYVTNWSVDILPADALRGRSAISPYSSRQTCRLFLARTLA